MLQHAATVNFGGLESLQLRLLSEMDAFATVDRATSADPAACANRTHYTAWAALLLALLGVGCYATAKGLSRADGTSQGQPEASTRSEASGQRSAFLDNAKSFLMVMVVLGHFAMSVQYQAQWPWAPEVRRFVQFHVLTYCFISGLVSRSPANWRGLKMLVMKVAMPWVLNALVLAPLMMHLVYRTPLPSTAQYARGVAAVLLHPGVAWYLPCLVLWRLWGWLLRPLESTPGARLGVALTLAAVTGYTHLEADPVPWMERATAFFPVYVLGQMFPLDWVLARSHLSARTLLVGVALLLILFAFESSAAGGVFVDALPHFGWARTSFCDAAQARWFWVRQLARHALELTKGLVLLFFCTPRCTCFLTTAGKYSLYTLLLHWYLVDGLRTRALPLSASSNATVMMCGPLAAFVAAVVVNILLASLPVRAVFWPLLEPVWLEGRTPIKLAGPVLKGRGAVEHCKHQAS